MKVLAKITALVFLLLGALLVLGGLGIAFMALAKSVTISANPSPFLGDTTVWMRFVQLLGAGAVTFQGLLLGALGEALWLLADIAAGVARQG